MSQVKCSFLKKCIECLRRWAQILASVPESALPVHRICFSSWRARLCLACAVILFASFRSESLQPVQLICATMLQNAGNHPEIWTREVGIAPSECPSYNRCTLCMDSAPRASDSFTLCSDPTRPKGQANSQHKSNNNSLSISNSKSKIEHAGRDIRHILHSWGGAGSLHRVGESEALGAASMHGVHGL